jgi:hypothetical protein
MAIAATTSIATKTDLIRFFRQIRDGRIFIDDEGFPEFITTGELNTSSWK